MGVADSNSARRRGENRGKTGRLVGYERSRDERGTAQWTVQ